MAQRYKVKEYKKFSSLGQTFSKEEGNDFFDCSDIDFDKETGLPKIAKKMTSQTITDLDFFVEDYRGMKFLDYSGNYYYMLISDADNVDCMLYRSVGPGTDFTLKYTFDSSALGLSGLDFISSVYCFDDLVVVIASDSTGGDNSLFYSSDGGATFTLVDISTFGEFVFDHVIKGEKVYILTEKGIYESTDGYTFSEYLAFESDRDDVSRLFFSDGFFYFTDYSHGNFKIYKIGDNKEIERICKISTTKADCHVTDEGIYIFSLKNEKIEIRFYDKDSLQLKRRIPITEENLPTDYTESYIFAIGEHENQIFFEIVTQLNDGAVKKNSFIYTVEKDFDIKLLYMNEDEEPADTTWFYFRVFSIEDGFYILRSGENCLAAIYDNVYLSTHRASGVLITSIEQISDCLPKQLKLFHDSLPAGATVKLYYKKDKASSWTLAVTSSTTSAIKKVYTFATGSVCDFIQFKIVATPTADTTTTPENIFFKFLYNKIGLEEAK